HLGPGTSLNTARMSAPRRPPPVDTFDICAETPVRGLSTSGQVANTVSLGIADRVTVLAASAAAADAAATLIADAVNVDDPAVKRVPASQLDPHSDLGGLPVTVAVGALSAEAVGHALDSGSAEAERLASGGLIHCATLMLGAQRRLIGPMQAGRRVERIADLAAPSARIGLLAGRTQAVQ
ncbi:MAG: hypothetical protein K2Q10_11185, partial [Rhodospirillales bacterium]|nr:hypothetical protein [Rhodospirillales bacterium]